MKPSNGPPNGEMGVPARPQVWLNSIRLPSLEHGPASAYGALTVWLFVSFLVFYVATTRGHFWSTDEIAVYQQTRSLWEHGDLSIEKLNNAVPGRGGKYYAPWAVGQSVLSLPLYGLGKAVRGWLELAGAPGWIPLFAGETIQQAPGVRWGGDVEIFFVNLFNAIAVAALAAVFFAFNLRLGAAPQWSLGATLLLGLATHVAGFSTGYFQHPAEALFLLWTFYFLFCDGRNPAAKTRLLAGLAAAAMILVRVQTGVALPALTLYLLWNLWKRAPHDSRRLTQTLQRGSAFLVPAAAAILLTSAVNYLKFGQFDIGSVYLRLKADQGGFENPVVAGLYGMLFSPGASILVFSPLLVLAPRYFRGFAGRFRAETAVIFAIVLGYVLLYVKDPSHGQWSFGPRFLMPLVPLLLLPLASCLPELRPAGRWGVAILAAIGLFIEILHVAVNVTKVYYAERYLTYVPQYSYLYIPRASQIAAHWRALVAWDNRVDFWLLNVARHFGIYPLMWLMLVFVWLLWWCLGKVSQHLRDAQAAHVKGFAVTFAATECRTLGVVALVWLAIAYEVIFIR